MLTLEVNGVVYNDALSINVKRDIDNFCGSFSVTSSANVEDTLPIKTNDDIKVLADGVCIFNGIVEAIQVGYSSNRHTIRASGRDRTCDILDSTVSGSKSFEGPITFNKLARDVLNAGNMDFLDIVDEIGDVQSFSSGEIVSAEVGQSIYDFLESYARKKQFLIVTNEDGNVLLFRASKEKLGIHLRNVKNSVNNNILSASFYKDVSRRFNQYISQSQLNPYNQGSNVSPRDISNQTGLIGVDPDIRESRILEFNTEEDEDTQSSFNRAQFEANVRRAKSADYQCVVQGHSFNGNVFKINRLASITDDFAKIKSDMLLSGVEYVYSLDDGSKTFLSFTYPDAYGLSPVQEERERARSEIGDEF